MNSRLFSTCFATLLFITTFGACAGQPGHISLMSPVHRLSTAPVQPNPTAQPAQIMNRQQLAEYQATLPSYAESLTVAKRARNVTYQQINDRQIELF